MGDFERKAVSELQSPVWLPSKMSPENWDVVFAYARRWQIEMSFRYGKSELAMESPRLWKKSG